MCHTIDIPNIYNNIAIIHVRLIISWSVEDLTSPHTSGNVQQKVPCDLYSLTYRSEEYMYTRISLGHYSLLKVYTKTGVSYRFSWVVWKMFTGPKVSSVWKYSFFTEEPHRDI